MQSEKMRKMNGDQSSYDRKAVCRQCGCIMKDMEQYIAYGSFWHPSGTTCPNSGGTYDLTDTKKISEFVRKRVRRAAKRAGTSV